MRRLIKGVIVKSLHKFGYTLVPYRHLSHFAEADFLARLLRLLDINCVLDVGANTGQYRDFLRHDVCYAGTIVSFEPIPGLVQAMQARAKGDHDWIIEGYALGRVPGKAEFNVMSSTVFSSFLQPDNRMTDVFKDLNVVQDRITAEVRTLNEVLPLLQNRLGQRNYYLKIDTQGFDLEVIAGASEVLHQIRALQSEASVTPIYGGLPDYRQTIETLRSLGFELSGMFPNNPDLFPRLIEFDCYLTNKEYVPKT
jgi:FkbM family methyltransferase